MADSGMGSIGCSIAKATLNILELRLKRRVKLVTYRGAGHNDLPWDRVYEQVLIRGGSAIT